MINNEEFQDEIGNNHISTNAKNPLRKDAFAITDEEKIDKIKNEEYAGEYSSAGRIIILTLIAGVGAITMFGIVIFFLAAWIYKSITD